MSPTLDAFFRSWPWEPGLAAALLAVGGVYCRGWLALRRRDPRRWHAGRPTAFCAGLAVIFLALASPIEPFAAMLLEVHMVQHLLLMMVAPPLLWLGSPLFPLLRGLPEAVRTVWAAPLLRVRWLRGVFGWLTHPLVAGPLYVAVTWLWHAPAAFQLALERGDWHRLEHASFLAAALLFWYPVVRPYPSRPHWSRWLLFPYLILADVQNTLLAAWLTFSSRVIYAPYAQVPRIAGLTALDDQSAAGVIMWVPGSIAFLLPLFWIGLRMLFGAERGDAREKRLATRIATTNPAATARPAFDLLTLPLIGPLLRRRFSRLALQFFMAALAALVVYDGLAGPQVGAMNLAGVLPWIHWRGLLILGLLVAGNVFCLACPFTLPRTLARHWLPTGRPWPRALRSKWLAVALVALFLWSYDAFSLWDNPWLTAWIVLGYFVAAFVVDVCFSGAAFCKYVCPIGQFNFVQSLVSPLEVKVREPQVCTSCATKECIRGTSTIPGCELQLFQPRKSGNMDCTFCLACVQVCPQDNVGLLAVVPGQTLAIDPLRSGVGRFSRRADLAALVLLLVFGAFANAAGMVAPVVVWQDELRQWLGNPPQLVVTTAYYVAALLVLPGLLIAATATLGRWLTNFSEGWLPHATRYAYTLVPMGFGMWLAHYSFHLLTSWATIVPVTQRFVAGLGWTGLGDPLWQRACCRPAGEGIVHLEMLMLGGGLLLSMYTAFRIAESQSPRASEAIKAFAPWGMLTLLLYALGVWIVLQPMQMRGTLSAG